MQIIQLIVMGTTERLALATSLQTMFPSARGGVPVQWAPPIQAEEPAKARLPPLGPAVQPSGLMTKLARTLIWTTTTPARPGAALPSLVLAIGDVELNNLGQENLLIEHLRSALSQELGKYAAPADRTSAESALQDRCSYHLLRPMLEASFFGDDLTLKRLGVDPSTPKLKERDVELFESVDPSWLSTCAGENARRPFWWRHERHPEKYLTHLLQTRPGPSRTYNKTRDGVPALENLLWGQVVDSEESLYLRALFDDLADWFGVPSPLAPSPTTTTFALTHPSAPRSSVRVLRNL